MRNDHPESSFQSPANYREYAKEARMALAVYQRIRRPLMFHILLIATIASSGGFLIAALASLPILGIVACFRRFEDGFDADADDDHPRFKLSTTYTITGSSFVSGFRSYLEDLQYKWFWCTWKFYPTLIIKPILGIFVLIFKGGGLFMDLFFLNNWDRWLKAIEEDEGSDTEKHLRGSQLEKMPKSSGSSPVQWVKKKAGQAKGATMTFLEMCGYDEAKERARMEQAKGKKQPKAKEREKPAKDDDSLTTDESEESSK